MKILQNRKQNSYRKQKEQKKEEIRNILNYKGKEKKQCVRQEVQEQVQRIAVG